jgi:hypothetical protein
MMGLTVLYSLKKDHAQPVQSTDTCHVYTKLKLKQTKVMTCDEAYIIYVRATSDYLLWSPPATNPVPPELRLYTLFNQIQRLHITNLGYLPRKLQLWPCLLDAVKP